MIRPAASCCFSGPTPMTYLLEVSRWRCPEWSSSFCPFFFLVGVTRTLSRDGQILVPSNPAKKNVMKVAFCHVRSSVKDNLVFCAKVIVF